MLGQRILSAIALVAGIAAATVWLPTALVSLVILALALLGVREFAGILRSASLPCNRTICVLATTGYMLTDLVAVKRWGPAHLAEAETVVLGGIVLLIVLHALVTQEPAPVLGVTGLMAAVLYIPFLLNFINRILFLPAGDQDGRALLLYGIAVVKTTDTFAYLVGSWIGRHRMAPHISPGKTWEGSAAGVAGGIGMGWAAWRLTGGDLHVAQLHGIHVVVLPAILAVAGILGDLVESMFKRSAGVKDSGTAIRGMGGMLDVIDSLLLALPVLYVYVSLFLTE